MPFKSSNRARKGFTLIELIIYIVLVAAILSALLFIVDAALRTRSIAVAEGRLLDNERLVERTLLDRLNASSNVISPASGSGTTLQIASPTSSENPVLFQITNGALTMKLGSSSAITLTSSNIQVTAFTVTRVNGTPSSIRISITYQTGTAANATISNTSTLSYTLRYD